MLRIKDLKIPACSPEGTIGKRISSIINIPESDIKEIVILRRTIDARKKRGVSLVYNLHVSLSSPELEERALTRIRGLSPAKETPPWKFPHLKVNVPPYYVPVVGAGPAGLFAAYTLASYGFRVAIIERGKPFEERVKDVSRFWRKGGLDGESNVQFGEGGAGTFSDGKLTTRIKAGEARFIINTFSRLGGGPALTVEGKPHMGTNRLHKVVLRFREMLQELGVEFKFNKRFSGIGLAGNRVKEIVTHDGEAIDCGEFILAPGHSARDTFAMLGEKGVAMECKPFAVGIRVEHPQELIDDIQYGKLSRCGCLPAADYRMAVKTSSNRPVYTFCMCPGGYVILASSEEKGLPVNGMSPTLRKTGFASSGLVAAVGPSDFGNEPFSGLRFQARLEEAAFALAGGKYRIPSSSLLRFVLGEGSLTPGSGRWAGPGRVAADLRKLFSPVLGEDLAEGIKLMDKKMRGFLSKDANAYGVESRTSSPLRILRGADRQSLSHDGIYPAGEGSGYAGGIVSSAVDGIKTAMAIVRKYER